MLTASLRHYFQRSLRARMVVLLITVVWLVVILFGAVDGYMRQQELLSRAEENADRIASLMADALARPLYDFNQSGAESAALALTAFPEIVSARVLDHEGNSVTENLPWHPEIPAPIKIRREILYIDTVNTTPVGTLEFAMSTQAVDAEMAEFMRQVLVVSLLLSAAIVAAVMFIFRSVTKPMGDIYEALEKLGRGNTDIRLSGLERKDELGRMSLAVDKFRESIRMRTAVENELEAMVAQNQAILNNALVGIVFVQEGRLISVNRRVEELSGLSAVTLHGSHASDFFVDQADFEELKARASDSFAIGQSVSMEVRLRRANGSVFWGALTGRTTGDPTHDLSGSIWVVADVDERRRAQKELELHRQHLETLVEQRTRQLLTAQQEALEATAAKSRFLATMTHEIRTPMNAIVGLSQLALQTSLTRQQRDYLDKIVLSGRIMLQLINDILDLSKIEAGRLELENRVFQLADVLDQSAAVGRNLADSKGLAFNVVIEENVPAFLMGDDLRLTQVLNNLVSNAVKFTETGEVSITCQCMQLGEREATLQFRVRDTGIGLSQEQKERLFRPFTQADSSTTRRFGGTGLGLTISRQIVQLMGGRIDIHSTPNVGSIFLIEVTFQLPTAEQAREAQSQLEREDLKSAIADYSNRFNGIRILVAEDNEINQQVIIEFLIHVGATVDIAGNGREALDALADTHYDLILMDMMMPEMDGLEATALLRRDQRWQKIPIIALTANATNEDRQRCLEAGMNDFLSKPIEASTLYRKIDRWINKTRPAKTETTTAQPLPATTPSKKLPAFPPIEGVDTEILLRRMMGRPAFCLQVLRKFQENNETFLDRMDNALGTEDWDSARRHAHTLKGSAGTIAASELNTAAIALEEACVAKDTAATREAMEKVKQHLSNLFDGIAALPESL